MRRVAIVAAAAVLLTGALGLFFWRNGPAPASATVPATGTAAAPGIFGVNMPLGDAGDELATDAATQATLRGWRVPLIRVPLRSGLSDAALTQAMRAVNAVGATPMLVLPGPKSTLADNRHLLGLVTGVFGDRRVYLEYGTGSDLAGIDAAGYTAGWNRAVPVLKQSVPAAYRWVGPVRVPAGAASFAANAKPAPDYLSWQEYACDSAKPDSYCTGEVTTWATYANTVESAVRAAVGHPIPFFVSEWNLDSNDEGRYGNAGFIQPWTKAALAQLLDLTGVGLAGAMLSPATGHGDFGLIDHGRLTPQGTVFRDLLTVATSAAPPPDSPPATASAGPSSSTGPSSGGAVGGTGAGSGNGGSGGGSNGHGTAAGGGAPATAPGGVYVGFEDGLDGWGQYWGNDKFQLFRTTGPHWDGSQSLKMFVPDGSAGGYLATGTQSGVGNLRAGDRITFHVWASGKGAGTIRSFVMDTGFGVHFPQNETVLPNSAGWLTVTFNVPSGVAVHAIGLQFYTTVAANWIALDGLSWPG